MAASYVIQALVHRSAQNVRALVHRVAKGVKALVHHSARPVERLVQHVEPLAQSEPHYSRSRARLEDGINHGRIAAVTAHGYIEMQGGLPIVIDGQVIGDIGASFDTPEHDVQIAQAGLVALNC